jgi:hypothetical protein
MLAEMIFTKVPSRGVGTRGGSSVEMWTWHAFTLPHLVRQLFRR